MKVALLLSGRIRDGIKNYKFLEKNLLSKYDVDIFINYSYDEGDEESYSAKQIEKKFKPKLIRYSPYHENFKEYFKNFENIPHSNDVRPINLLKMLYSVKSANELKSIWESINGFKYDVVIKSRFDLKILEPINLKESIDTIFIPIGADHLDGYNDLFAFGDSISMDYYCNLYENILGYVKCGVEFHPEILLKHHLNIGFTNVYRFYLNAKLRDIEIVKTEYKTK